MARVHILGASGSGASTLGAAVAERLDVPHLDTDDFYWHPTNPPFRRKRLLPERLERLAARLDRDAGWVLSGSLASWGDPLVPRFGLVVFLSLDPALRMARLRARELRRHGARIGPGGDMAGTHAGFMAWAAAYDTAGLAQRSRARHEAWLADLPTPVLRLDSADAVHELVEAVLAALPRERRRAS